MACIIKNKATGQYYYWTQYGLGISHTWRFTPIAECQDENLLQKLKRLEEQGGSFITVSWHNGNAKCWALFHSERNEGVGSSGDDYYEAELIASNGELPICTPSKFAASSDKS